MHERYQAGIVHQSMEPQSEAITARPESGRSGIPEKRSSQLIKRAKDALENSKAKGVRSFAAATILASSILGACKFENENGNPPPPGLTPIERTLPPGVATSNPNPTELPTVIVTPITPIEGTEKPNPTETPGTETPTATETVVETPTVTETPSVTPTPETPTPTETPVESELPYEIGWEMTVGNVTLAVTKDMQERTECEDAYNNETITSCPSLTELYLNSQDTPDAADKLKEGVQFGLYKAWIEQGQGDKSEREQMTFEDFKAELKNKEGKDLTFQVSGIRRSGDKDVTGLITIDPRKPINFVWIAQPETYSTFANNLQIGAREANGEIYLETFDALAAGIENPTKPEQYKYLASTTMEFLLSYLATQEAQVNKPDFSMIKKLSDLSRPMDEFFIIEKGTSSWNGIVQAK